MNLFKQLLSDSKRMKSKLNLILGLFFLLCFCVFTSSVFSQTEKSEPTQSIKDGLREQYTERDYQLFLTNEKSEKKSDDIQIIYSPAAADALVNNNNGSAGTGNFTQSETSIIAFGTNVLIGFNDSGSNAGGASKFTGFSYSTDGGISFVDGGTLPTNAGGDAGDPVIARNETTGRIYFSTLGYNVSTIQVFRSDDGGLTWSAPINGTPGGSSEDKQWITVDNFTGTGNGNVYLISRRFGGTPGIYLFRSTDNGNTFIPSGGVNIFSGGQGAFVAVGPDHSVYAFYYNGTNTILVRKSTDYGATFGSAVTVVSGLVGGINGDLGLVGIRQGTSTASSFRSSEFPHAAVNPVNGDIYVTFANDGAGSDKADIFMVTSTNGGITWSSAVKVNDDITTTDQWMPTIAVNPGGSKLGIFYYSRQEDAANNLFKYYGRLANISGSTVTFEPGFAISDVGSLPEFGRDNVVNSVYMGDYNQAFATSSDFHVIWSDNRDDLPGGAPRKDPNVYYEKISIGPPCPIDPASNPNPVSGTTELPISGNTISWTNGTGANQIEIWFGEVGNVNQVYNGVPIPSFSLAGFEPLEYNTPYQWRIVGKNDTCNVGGPTWSFTTMQNPNLVIDSLFCEAFESGLSGWTVTNDGGTSGCIWQIRMAPFPNTYTLPPTSTGGIMSADVDECGTGSTMSSTATLNQSFDLSIYTSVWIEFDNDWNVLDAQDEAHVEVSTNGGSTWTGVWDKIGADIRNTHEVVDISLLTAGQTNVKFRLRSVQPGWDWWWVLDNFCIYGMYEIQANTFQLSVDVTNGWNMVSIAGLNSPDQNVNTWWAFRDLGANVFKYGGGYQAVTDAIPGIGYWMKHTGARTYNTGDEWPAGGIQIVPHDPVQGATGWNLFGGYELSVTAANVTTNPPGLQQGSIFKYSGGYQTATTLDPGYGYWIKLSAAGQIIIPETLAKGTEPVEYFPENWGKIVMTDATGINYTLYAVKGEVNLDNYELPPAPPAGMFDIRFSSGRIAEDINSSVKTIDMSGVTYPLTVRVEGMDMRLMDETGKTVNVNLKSGENVVISDATIQKLMVSGELIPAEYALEQNYPNPFNPSTTFQFGIPSEAKVSLIIYDALGSEVETIVNDKLDAGYYKYQWNASGIASGVYFYRLTAGDFISTKKLLLLK